MELRGGVWGMLIWITKYKLNQGCDANNERLHGEINKNINECKGWKEEDCMKTMNENINELKC